MQPVQISGPVYGREQRGAGNIQSLMQISKSLPDLKYSLEKTGKLELLETDISALLPINY